MNGEPIRRRDWLVAAAFGMAGVGGVMALWPMLASMTPAADTRAKATVFKLNALDADKPSIIAVGAYPVMIFRRTPGAIEALRATTESKTLRGSAFRDPQSSRSKQPNWAKNWHRSLKPEIMVCIANCTREGCVVSHTTWQAEPTDALRCLCCGATFDLAGRVYAGPASRNLTVPNHRFIGDQAIEFNEFNLMT